MAFSATVFLIGTVAFLVVDQANRSLRDELLRDGVRTEGLVLSSSDEPERVMNQTSFRWQYLSSYTVRFTYQHDGIGWVDVETSTTESVHDDATRTATVDVVHLAGEPHTARLLDDGRLPIPNLRVFAVVGALLLAGAVWQVQRTFRPGGRTASRPARSVMAFVHGRRPIEVDRSDPLVAKYRSWAPFDDDDRSRLTRVYTAPDDPVEFGAPTDMDDYWQTGFPIALGRYPNLVADVHRDDSTGNLFLVYVETAGHVPERRCRFLDPDLVTA
jgi:hypothetical protein